MSELNDLYLFSQIKHVQKINNITLIGDEYNSNIDYYDFANYLRCQYKSCLLSPYKTEIFIQSYEAQKDNSFQIEDNGLSYVSKYLGKNNCNVTKCDYRFRFSFYKSIDDKNIKNIIEIINCCNKILEYIDKKDFPLILIHRLKLMETSLQAISLKNEEPLIKLIKQNLNKNKNDKSFKRVLINSFHSLKLNLLSFQIVKQADLELWYSLKTSFENFCDNFKDFFSFVLYWCFLYNIEKFNNSNIVIIANVEHIKMLKSVLTQSTKSHKLLKHMDYFD
jgi:hypothetical protein